MPSLQPLDTSDAETLVGIWNAACGADLKITRRLVQFNSQPPRGAFQAGRVAIQEDRPVGFVVVSALPSDPLTSPPEVGWIEALAVEPGGQRQGVGSALLEWAKQWLIEQGCTVARLGGGLRPFVAGYPVELKNEGFFLKRGFTDRANAARVWDVARDLGDEREAVHTASHRSVGERSERDRPSPTVHIHAAESGNANALLEFFEREFPNRWRFEYQEFLRMNGRLSDWLLLLTARGIDGFARMTFEDSRQPIQRFYPYRLPRPWGQLGPLGVSRDLRGQGYGRALIAAALVQLRARGVRGAVIDWTEWVDLYSKFGFQPFREYRMLFKELR